MIRLPVTNKYGNTKTIIDGITFASKKEAKRYPQLKLLERAHEIQDLVIQPKFILLNAFTDNTGKKWQGVTYIADFMYKDKKTGGVVVEDVKGHRTKEYLLKRKLFLSTFPAYTFQEL